MILQSENLTLYHASALPIKIVDLSLCRKRNDFGRGFYLTTSRDQAERFVRTAIRKSGKDLKSGCVNVYNMADFKDFNCHEFITTDEEWLHCVCGYRKQEISLADSQDWDAYDVLIGKIANDDTMTTLSIYLQNGYGEYGSPEAVSMAVSVLKPQRLKDQVCLKSEKTLSKLTFIDAYEVVPR